MICSFQWRMIGDSVLGWLRMKLCSVVYRRLSILVRDEQYGKPELLHDALK